MSPDPRGENGAPLRISAVQHCCNYCNASFTRLEHMKRHQAMHSKVKSYTCLFCSKCFARSDVLRRHYQSCKPAQQTVNVPAMVSRRVNRACSTCRLSKVKCSGLQPCERCSNMGQGHLCRFTLRKARLADGAANASPKNAIVAASSAEPQPVPAACNPPENPTENPTENPMENELLAPASMVVADPQAQTSASGSQTAVSEWMNESEDLTVELVSDQASMGSVPMMSLVDALPSSGTDDTLSFPDMGLGTGMLFDLDLLDYSIFDNSLLAYENDVQCSTVTESSNESTGSIGGSPGGKDTRHADTDIPLPQGIDLVQISPLEYRRKQILQYLYESAFSTRSWDRWLSSDNMARYLRTYFSVFHRHTPLIHLPSWNISTTSTRLVFSMVLMGAMYAGDLNSKNSTDRHLCQLAQAFAWSTDTSLQAKNPAQLDTIQAVYLATLLEAFYFPAKRQRPPIDTRRLVTEARHAGVFSSRGLVNEPWKLDWSEWCACESRLRTAFILYLFDAIQAIFFDQRPEIQLHELDLPLPCDENIFAAGSEEEWRSLYMKAQDLTRVEYLVVLSLFLYNRPMDLPLNFSVMGGFIILHGILLHILQQRSICVRKDQTYVPGTTEQAVRKHLAVVQSQVADNALKLWLGQWKKTMARPASAESHGLYRDRALVYWFLGNVMNRNDGLAGMEAPAVLSNGQWRLKIPSLLKRLTVLVDSGQLDGVNEGATSGLPNKLASYLGDLHDASDVASGGEGIDAIVISYIMSKERK